MPGRCLNLFTSEDSERRAVWLRRWLSGCALVLVGCTWPLWTPHEVFPQVPLLQFLGRLPTEVDWLGTVGLLAGIIGALVAPTGRAARAFLLLFAGSAIGLMLLDQQRMQPWAYQFMLLALALAGARAREALGLIRLLVVSFYLHSAWTKCDYSFTHNLGQQFLETLVHWTGHTIVDWSISARLWGAALFPLGELLVALLLLIPRGRVLGLALAVLLHVALIGILGPWGLNHRPGVLIWNVYFIGQNLLLFWPVRPSPTLAGELSAAAPNATWSAIPKWLLAVFACAIVFPLGEPFAWWDMWPSWGLYASSAERLVLEVHRNQRDKLPAQLDPFIEEPENPLEPWLRVRLDRWALAALGAPVYPNNRVQLGVAIALAGGADLGHQARIVRRGQAARLTGERASDILVGPIQAEAAADEYLFNARPRRAFRGTP